MPVTLAQAQLNTADDIDFAVIDDLRRYSWLLDRIVFDDVVTPGTGGGSLTYGYTRLKTPRTAAFRAYNSDYTAAQAERERFTVDLAPLGGSFSVDRILADLGPSQSNEVTFQMQQLLTAVQQKFQETLINGDTAVDANSFDGLNKALTDSTTEYDPLDHGTTAGYLDWTPTAINDQAKAMAALDAFDEFLSTITPSRTGGGDIGQPGALPAGEKAILGNTKSIMRVKALARWAGLYTAEKDDVGRQVEKYGDWTLVNVGDGQSGSSPIVPIYTADADGAGSGTNITGLTDLYAVTFGLDALHGASVAGRSLMNTIMPDFSRSESVQTGVIEMGPVAMVLKSTKACAVMRKVKVQ